MSKLVTFTVGRRGPAPWARRGEKSHFHQHFSGRQNSISRGKMLRPHLVFYRSPTWHPSTAWEFSWLMLWEGQFVQYHQPFSKCLCARRRRNGRGASGMTTIRIWGCTVRHVTPLCLYWWIRNTGLGMRISAEQTSCYEAKPCGRTPVWRAR